ncbi:MAG: hypothetical protein KDC84_00450 [Crocinitomicaceae bacterium]|nr:hypothetical protein [Crocinitomicaceae bacterium]
MKIVYVLLLFIPTALINLTSCVKESDTIAVIQIRDTSNVAVPDARVVLFGVQNPNYPNSFVERYDTLFTNQSGQAIFNYTEAYKLGQAGFAVLEIRAKKGVLEGSGTIRINAQETNSATVIIEP